MSASRRKPTPYQPLTEDSRAKAEEQIVEQSKRIDFYLTEYTLEILAKKLKVGDFVIPSYQREFTWEQDRKSRFIESLLMGLPIPFLFFWEAPDTGKLEIVDGSQRLRTIEEFIDGALMLTQLEQLPILNGAKFSDLTESRQRKFKNKSIRGIVLNEHADEAARLDLFDRLNTGSKHANKAEVRRGALSGPFMDLIAQAAESQLFRKLAPVPPKAEREREREELVARFFAYSDGLEGYHDRVSDFLHEHAKRMNERFSDTPTLAKEYLERFETTLEFVDKNFSYGFRRMAEGKATPRTRFEAIAVGAFEALQKKPQLSKANIDTSWATSDEFREVIGADGANAVARLKGRIDFVRDRLLRAAKP